MKRKVSFQTTRLTTARDCERARTGQETRNCPVRAERDEITRIEPQFIKCAIVSRYRTTMRKAETEDEQASLQSKFNSRFMQRQTSEQNSPAKGHKFAKLQGPRSLAAIEI